MTIEFDDGFTDQAGRPDLAMPLTHDKVELIDTEYGTRMILTMQFDSADDMQKALDMGAEEGNREAFAQIDDLLESARQAQPSPE